MTTSRWTPERANRWAQEQPWLVGCNFIPSTASNQFEMWQLDTFDPETRTFRDEPVLVGASTEKGKKGLN